MKTSTNTSDATRVGSTGGSANVTRDGIEVQIGQRWQDQDKRMRGRVIEVRAVADGYAYFGPRLNRKIAIRRMHKHSTGFVLLPNKTDQTAGENPVTKGNR